MGFYGRNGLKTGPENGPKKGSFWGHLGVHFLDHFLDHFGEDNPMEGSVGTRISINSDLGTPK